MTNFIQFKSNHITDYLFDNHKKILSELVAERLEHKNYNVLEVQDWAEKPMFTTFHTKKPIFTGNFIVVPLKLSVECAIPSELKLMNWDFSQTFKIWENYLDKMPTIKKWIIEHNNYCKSAIFNIAQPGSKLNHHYGPDTNLNNFRIHLCLTSDGNATFDIENERYTNH